MTEHDADFYVRVENARPASETSTEKPASLHQRLLRPAPPASAPHGAVAGTDTRLLSCVLVRDTPPPAPRGEQAALTWWEKGCMLLQLHVGKGLLVLENTSIKHCGGTIGFFKRRPLW